jgi:hypothetical protein
MSIYIHKKSGHEYSHLTFGKMQIEQNWVECVVYKDARGDIYVRAKEDWNKKFHKK